MNNNVTHKGWQWQNVSGWNTVSAEFLPVSFDWAEKFHTMVDIGAGKGRHSFHMDKLGLSVKASDISESSIKIIEQKNSELGCNVKACQADMTALPFSDNEFDCAVCFHTIYHTDYQGLLKAVGEIKRVLRSGGEAYITFNSKGNASFQRGVCVDKHTIYKTEGIEKDIPHTYIDFDDLPEILDGFTLVKVQLIKNFVYNASPAGGEHYYVLARKN